MRLRGIAGVCGRGRGSIVGNVNVSPAAQWRHDTTGFVDRQFIPHKTMKDEKVPFFSGFFSKERRVGTLRNFRH